jgi:hypothetical protein
MPSELLIDGHPLDDEAEQIVDACRDTLPAGVTLVDLDEAKAHGRMSRGWFSHSVPVRALEARVLDRLREGEMVYVRVNRRWILRVVSRNKRVVHEAGIVSVVTSAGSPADAMALALWAAEKLAHFLPAASRFSDVTPPARGGGGSGGNAELGIPVWWARKARN